MKRKFHVWVMVIFLGIFASSWAFAEEETQNIGPSVVSREAFLFAAAHYHFQRGNFYDSSETLLKGTKAYPGWYHHDLDIVHLFPNRKLYEETRLNLEYLVPTRSTGPEAQKLRFLLAYIYFYSHEREKLASFTENYEWESQYVPLISQMQERIKERYRENSWMIGQAYVPPAAVDMKLIPAKNELKTKMIANQYHRDFLPLHNDKKKKSKNGDIAPITRKCFYSDSEIDTAHLSKDCLPYLMESFGRPSLNRVNDAPSNALSYPSSSLPSDPRLLRTINQEVRWLHRNLTNGRFQPRMLFLDKVPTPTQRYK